MTSSDIVDAETPSAKCPRIVRIFVPLTLWTRKTANETSNHCQEIPSSDTRDAETLRVFLPLAVFHLSVREFSPRDAPHHERKLDELISGSIPATASLFLPRAVSFWQIRPEGVHLPTPSHCKCLSRNVVCMED